MKMLDSEKCIPFVTGNVNIDTCTSSLVCINGGQSSLVALWGVLCFEEIKTYFYQLPILS